MHGIEYRPQKVHVQGHVVKDYPVLQPELFADDMSYGKCRHHPCLYGVLFQNLFVLDVVFESCTALAGNLDAENLVYGFAIACEGGARKGLSVAQSIFLPLQTEFLQRHKTVAPKGFDNPDVFA